VIEDKAPEILGPFSLYGIEGQAIVMDIEIYDSYIDEQYMTYTWFDEYDSELTQFKNILKPILILNDGEYLYKIEVEDQYGNIVKANITISVEDIPPIIFASDFMYSGPLGGLIELKAHAYDYYKDLNQLSFEWTLTYGDNTMFYDGGSSNSYSFNNNIDKMICIGQVMVKDVISNQSSIASFSIYNTIDSNQNGVPDDYEWMVEEIGLVFQYGFNYIDTDGDNLIDDYETFIGSNITNPDTDGDGLWDGYNLNGLGERTIGTNPVKNDTDDDGLSDLAEIIGWEVTYEYFGDIRVTSNPLDNDTDNDGLLDGDEFMVRTNPRKKDTDNDRLTDNLDPFPTKKDGDNDGLSDYRELILGTAMDNPDTDGDSLKDGEEVNKGLFFRTNPLSADTDADFLIDSAEVHTSKFEINQRHELNRPIFLWVNKLCRVSAGAQLAITLTFGESDVEADYGIIDVPDVEVSVYKVSSDLLIYRGNTNKSRYFSKGIDLRVPIESRGKNYLGLYAVVINDTESGCWLEQFEIDIATPLNPKRSDCDFDGILDGIEVEPLVNGTDIIDFKDTHIYNNLTTCSNSSEFGNYNEYLLEIPQIGFIYDADLTIQVQSDGVPGGNGNVSIELIKEDINGNIDDVFLINVSQQPFTSSSQYSYSNTLDLKSLVGSTIARYFGIYRLRIEVRSNNPTDIFNIEAFYINSETWVQPGPLDTRGWITDPTKWDTDGDRWSDKYEIYERDEPTNPLSSDTDGDGVWDFCDRDPLRNLILELNPIYGRYTNLAYYESSPTLQMTMSVKSHGTEVVFCTKGSRANGDLRVTKGFLNIFTYRQYRKAYFDGSHGSYDYRYYVDIDDNKLFQGKMISINVQLWALDEVLWIGDKRGMSSTVQYNIGKVGNEQTFKIRDTAKIKFRTVGMERSNTIAIYDENTVFNGHYQRKERINLIQLYIPLNLVTLLQFIYLDIFDGGTPFEFGPNNIVIPTSLFTKTLLNKHIQDETIDETVLYAGEDKSKFISIDRQGEYKEGCGEIDFIFVRFDISPIEAMEVLNMLLTCIVNDTTGETALKYKYVSTKENGYNAVLMNLPSSVLSLIPWLSLFESSPQGSRPSTLLGEIGKFFGGIVTFVVDIIVAVASTIAEIFTLIVNMIVAIIMAIIEFLVALVMLIITAAILIYIWIMFGLTLLFLTMAIAAMAFVFGPLALIFGSEMFYTVNSVGIDLLGFSLATGFDTAMGHYDTFDIPVPYINYWFSLGSTKIIDVTLKFWPTSFEFNSLNTTYQDKQISSGLEDYNLDANDFIVQPPNRKLEDQSISLAESEETSRSFVLDTCITAAQSLISGMSTSLAWWTIANPIGMVAITIPAEETIGATIKYTALIVAFTTYISGFLIQFALAQMDSYEIFWYLLGAGIISVINGIRFYKNGKPKIGPLDITRFNKELKELLDDLTSKVGSEIWSICLDLILLLPIEVLKSLFTNSGDDPDVLDGLIGISFDLISISEAVETWGLTFKVLEIASYSPTNLFPSYERDLKLYCGLSIAIGAIQIIIAGIVMADQLNE
jgi:hypothetical protein